jgi:glycosyltransferase involved in cell wall biosynthesis
VAFLDSDDEWHPGKLVAQMDYFKEANYQIQQTEEIWFRHGRRVNAPRHLLKKEGDIFDISLQRCMITPSSVCLLRRLFEKFGGFDESFPVCEDYELWLRITSSHEVGLIRKNYLVRYAGLPDQLSLQYPAMDRFRIRAMVKLLEEGVLNLNQKRICFKEMKRKVNVYWEGCRKRNKKSEMEWCDAINKRFFGSTMKNHHNNGKN